jgi:hypothetical protein
VDFPAGDYPRLPERGWVGAPRPGTRHYPAWLGLTKFYAFGQFRRPVPKTKPWGLMGGAGVVGGAGWWGGGGRGCPPCARAGRRGGGVGEGHEKKKHLCVIAIACAMATHLLTTNAVN